MESARPSSLTSTLCPVHARLSLHLSPVVNMEGRPELQHIRLKSYLPSNLDFPLYICLRSRNRLERFHLNRQPATHHSCISKPRPLLVADFGLVYFAVLNNYQDTDK